MPKWLFKFPFSLQSSSQRHGRQPHGIKFVFWKFFCTNQRHYSLIKLLSLSDTLKSLFSEKKEDQLKMIWSREKWNEKKAKEVEWRSNRPGCKMIFTKENRKICNIFQDTRKCVKYRRKSISTSALNIHECRKSSEVVWLVIIIFFTNCVIHWGNFFRDICLEESFF